MEPHAERPHMPGYGILGPDEGTGLLPWSWAHQRLAGSHDYWLATCWPDGRPHVMPVWGVFDGDALWFSCSPDSRKARNLVADPRCTVTTDDARNPVVLEGMASRVHGRDAAATFAAAVAAKYEADYGVEFFAANALFALRADRAFGLAEDDFTGSPTRWQLG